MKRLLCFILMLLLLIPSAMADEQEMTFRLENANGNVGDTVTVIGAVENAPVCASFRVTMTYDSTVLKPEKVKKLDCGGLFMSNVNFTYQGKSAINVLSASPNKSFEGNKQLFSITFTILAESPETDGSPINVVYKEFFDPSTPKPQPIQPTIENGHVYVGDDTPEAPSTGGNEGSTEDGNVGSSGDNDPTVNNPTDTPADGTTDTPVDGSTDTPADGETEIAPSDPEEPTTPEAEKAPAGETEEDSKKPTGSWVVDTETEDIYHVTEEGEETVFEPEYTEKPGPGKVTEVILKDKETGKEAGSIKVVGNEDGTFEVVEQDVPALRDPDNAGKTDNDPKGISIWVWSGIGGGVLLLAAGIALWYFLIFRKLK